MMLGMRTTVTLDPDTHRLVRRAMRVRGGTFKETVNAAIRRGLLLSATERRPFVVNARSMGLRVTDPKELRTLDEDSEIERFLGVTRRLQDGGE